MAGLRKKFHVTAIMKVFFEVNCLAFEPKSFVTNEGEKVEYNEVHFLNDSADGREVIKLNTKQGDKQWEDKEGVLGVEIDPSGKQKPKLISFIQKK